MDKRIEKLKEMVTGAKRIAAFTGAGISTDSGIPTYRGADGLWNKYDPAKYANFHYFMQDPSYYWQFFRDVRYPSLKQAQPNAAHCALVELEKQGKLQPVITQNIDGLHQLAGQKEVCELHGNSRRFLCLQCKKNYSLEPVYEKLATELPPYCECGGLLKPDVVFFGESLPAGVLERAYRAARQCDVFLVVGSSCVVYPAAGVPQIAKESGARLAIINIDETPLDGSADLVFHEKAAAILNQIVP